MQVCYGGAGNVSYSAAQKLGAVQWEIVSELAAAIPSVEAVDEALDMKAAARLLDEKLEPLKRELEVDLSTVAH